MLWAIASRRGRDRGAKVRLDINFEFCASHALPGLTEVAARVHGHNYVLHVQLEGAVDPATGVVQDFDLIDSVVKREIIDRVDHRDLNEFLMTPTAEVLLAWFWRLLAPHLPISRLRLQETRRYFAEYEGEPGVPVRYAPGYDGPA